MWFDVVFDWVIDPVAALGDLPDAYADFVLSEVELLFTARALNVAQWMKANHPWTNRTGLAEQSLSTQVVREAGGVALVLFYDPVCHYGRWLETRWGGKWGVLGPAVDFWGAWFEGQIRRMFA